MKNIKFLGWTKSVILIAVFTAINNLILGYNNPYVYILTALVGGCGIIIEATKKETEKVTIKQMGQGLPEEPKKIYIQKWVFIVGVSFTAGALFSLFWSETNLINLLISGSVSTLVGFLLWRILK